ncbi:MAG TPA: amino acid adenylation domain-containing protein, partial [Thermoanaerobaculia bacterium]|nr:amino acid adenylation domain-containing protein [Thermoanaerobaculia bacterium]
MSRPELIGRLTPAQEGIFLDSLMSTAPGVYLLQTWCEIHGPLDAAALRRAWGRLAARHQVLRTSFHHEGLPHPVQVVHRSVEIPWEEEDWRGRPEAAARQALEDRREADVRRPLHLGKAPLLRVLLVRLEEDRWWLLSTQHHLILDGWSQSVVLRELFALYSEERGGPPAALPPPRSFAECVAWLRGRDPGAAEAFWRQVLAGFRAPTPLDGAVRGGPPGASGETAAWLDAAATARLGELARGLRATPGALVHAAWLLLLARRSGEEDVCCGAVIATRPPHLAVEPSLVGMLVNTLPLRVRAALDRPLGAWLAEVHAALLDVREHAAAPPSAVRAWSEVPPGSPLFESVVAFESYPVGSGGSGGNGLAGLEITEVRARESAPFPLTLAATPGARLRLDLLYDRNRFDPAEAGRIVAGLEILLRALPGDPERRLADLSLLDEAGRHQVLTEWNDTAEVVPVASVLDLFAAWVERSPDAPALAWEGGEMSYAELERQSTEEAARLRAEGIGPEVPVPVTGDRSPEWIVSYLAVAKAGGVYVPVDADLPEERRRAMLGDLTPCPPLPSPPLPPGEGAPPPYLFYTSGSTGRPKGVWVDGRGLASFALDQARRFGVRPGDRVLQLSAPGFDGTLWEIWTALGCGAALCLAGRDETLPGPGLADLLRARKITHLFLPPSSLAAVPPTELPELRALAVGGEALPADLARRWARGRFLANVYGPTEATVWVMAGAVDAGETGPPPLGRPLPNVRAYVLDPWLAPLPVDAPGEICLGGPGLARGYLGQPDLTAERFVPDPFAEEPGGRLYRTGDRARLLPDGRLRFLGRLDAQVKVRGVRIEPAEVEAALRRVAGVQEATVVARDGRLVAYVTPREGPPGAVLRAALAERLPAPFVPSAYVRLAELPRTATGKLDRRALAGLAEETEETNRASPPRTLMEGALARIWGEVLGIEGIGREDDFWALGGHSLLAVRVAARVRAELGAELPIRTLFEARTLASLAVHVEEALAGPGDDLPPLVAVPRDAPLPLSLAQERLWLHERLEPGTYTIPAAVRLEGRLDLPALIHALAGLAVRHEALRTRFPARDGGVVQEVLPPGELPLFVADLAVLGSERAEPELRDLLQREAARLFDLERGPLWRAILARGAGGGTLLLSFHHIITDGWSLALFIRELTELYAAALAGRPAVLPALPVQPADVAAWQRRWLTGEALERRLAFWRDALAGFSTALDLPIDHPRAPVYRPRGARVPLALSSDLAAALRHAAGRMGATPFLLLLAGFAALLSRHTGQERIVIGAPVAGRRRAELEGLFGFFVDTLPLPVDLTGEPSLADLLARVRELALASWAHQDLPLERLIAALQVDRDPSRPPLVQAMLAFDNTPLRSLGALDLPGLTVTPVEIETGAAPFELSLDLADGTDGISGALDYAADLFDQVTADRLAGRFFVLLDGALADPGRPLAEIPAWSAAERHQVLVEWNDGRAGAPGLADLLAMPAARAPEAVALDDGERQWTYRELSERAAGLARHLRRRGVGPDVLVALVAESSPELVVGMLGALQAGAAFLPLDPAYPEERIALLLGDARPAVVLTREEISRLSPSPGGESSGAVPDGCLAYVLYTSGSTGRPKGALLSRGGLASVIAAQVRAFAVTPGSRVSQLASPGFDVAVSEIFVALAGGAELHLVPRAARLPGPDLVRLLRARRITHLAITPSALTVVPEVDLPDLAVLIVGGEACPPALARRWTAGRRLINAYGPTEGTIDAAVGTVEDVGGERVAVGRPIANAGIWLLGRDLRPVPAGVPGELCLGGAGLARGYLRRPGLTAERFLPSPFTPGERLYRTGDLARHRPDGTLEILGRIDDQLKVRGVRVEPGEVEAALTEHPAVRETAVAPGTDGRLVAFVVATEEPFDAGGLRAFLRARLPEAMIPSGFVPLESLPLTPNGKVDRRALAALRPEADAAGGAFADPVTEILAGIWGELLGAGRLGPEADFFDLGGHSLAAARVVARVREVLGVELPLRALFEAPTLAGLAERVRSAQAAEAAPLLVPAPRDGDLPLSFAQQRLWFLDQLRPGDPAYNLPHALALEGDLDVPALAATLGELVRRHEALRTRLAGIDQIDLTALPAAAHRAEARRLAGEEALRPFDLARGPLLRAALLRLGDREWHLLLTIHHIAADGWSIGLLIRELGALYTAFSQGRPSPLSEPRLQYGDYAVWQRRWLAGEILERQISWWKTALAGAPTVLELPSDRPRRPVRGGRGGSRTMNLPETTAAALRALVRREGATLFMGLFAAWGSLLARHAGQGEVVLGTPVANRPRPELEEIVGFFVNTLALRLDLRGAPSFRDLLAQARTTTLDAWAHQDLPFERLVDELGLERDLARTPLFQHVLALQNAPVSALELPGLTLRPVDVDETAAKYDLLLSLAETPGSGLAGVFEYDAGLFDPPTIDRLAGRFAVLLAAALAAPDDPVQDLPLWTDPERHQIVHEWNGLVSAAAVPTLHDLFEHQAARRPGAIAVTCGSERLTYGDLNARADRLAERLRAAGVGPGTLVGLAVERSLDLVAGILGILKAGGAYLPLDPDYPEERLAFLREDSGARLVVENKDIKVFKDFKGEDFLPSLGSLADSAAYVIYTSGSTGRPKGVPVTHANVAHLLAASADLFAFGPDDVWTLFHSFAFDFSVWEIWGALAFGGRLVVVPYWVSRSPDLFWELLVAEGVTVLNQTPSAFRQLIPVAGTAASVPPLRWIVFGGEALDPASLRPWFHRFGDAAPRLVNMYGITETTVHVTFRPLTAADAGQPSSRIGRALPHLRTVLLDASLQPLPIGVPGELCVGGAGVARGYLGRPELTAERFLPDPFGGPGERLYRSGDLARWRPGGDLEYLGRIDAQVKLRGFRIEPGEVEAALAEHPEVREAAVVLREGPGGSRQLAAFVASPGAGEELTERLRGFLRERLPEPFVPALFVLLPTLPLTPQGKVDRPALSGLPLTPEASAPAPASGAPWTPAEEILTAVWAEVLGTRPGLDDSFFALGGDSILSLQVRARAAERGLAFSLQDLFEHQTVRSLARALEGGAPEIIPATAPFSLVAAADRERLPADLEDAFPLSSLQSGFVFHSGLGRDWLVYLNSLHLRASFDAGSLREAVAGLLRRHPMLRTSFALAGFSEPLQLVHRRAPVPLEIEDLRDLPGEEREARITAWTDAELARPFDWARAPLIRFYVHRRTDDTFQLTMSEPFLDGWSVATCLTELLETYLERVEPARPSVSYRDFVALERAALASPEARAWWERTLAGATATALAPGAAGSSNVRAHAVPLPRDVGERLARLAAAEALPLKSVLLTAHLRALGAATGQTDVVTGLLVNGRPEVPDGERVLGVFLNSLPFRLRFDAGSWTGLARRAFAVEREMLPYRRFPLAELQRAHGALFDTLFNFTHFHVARRLAGVPGLEVLGVRSSEQTYFTLTAHFDLDPGTGSLALALIYDAGRLSAIEIERLAGLYARVLAALATDPAASWDASSLLAEEERHQLLVEANDTGADREDGRRLHDLVRAQVERTPEAVALIWEEERLSYDDLWARAEAVAARLRDHGTETGARVVVCLERSPELIATLLGVLLRGAAYVPVDPAWPRERRELIIEDSSSLPSFGSLDLAYVLYTSGSTGRPKGVAVTHGSAVALLDWAAGVFGPDELAGVLAATSISFDLSVFEIFLPLSRGGTVILARDVLALPGLPAAEEVTLINTVPS